MPGPSSRHSRAEEVFDDYLTRLESGQTVAFEPLCATHPDCAAELRGLRAGAEALRRAQQNTTGSASLSERLKDKFGGGFDPTLSLEHEPKPDSATTGTLIEKLRTEGLRGTRYKLLGEIARGGMGAIIKIWDDELRRTLAMKVVLGRGENSSGETPSVDPNMLGRFLEEAQVTGQLDHPGIVPVHELGLGSDGRVYFTMRLVKGEDLCAIFEHVRSGRDGWSRVRALGVMLKVCEAMSYAHSKKVVHRDLKPANIMVGQFGEVYVMDWGLARVLGREDKHDLRLKSQPHAISSAVKTERQETREETADSPLITMDGDVVGTPSYMPPEQARGQLEKLGPHSDVYAVGAMLYQLFSGRAPFVPPDARVSPHSILMRLLEGPPKPLHELAPQAPAELIAITEKAMGREIADRYPTMQALADDLRAYTEGHVVSAYETGGMAEARKWVQRNKPLAAALGTALALLIAGLTTSLVFKSRADLKAVEAAGQARIAMQKANDVLSLSASKNLEELVLRAEKLWPARPEMIPQYEQWLADAHALIDGRAADVAHNQNQLPSLEAHKAKLRELRERAIKPSAADLVAERGSHPQFEALTKKRAELTWRSRMLGLEPWPNVSEVEAQLAKETLPADANELNALAWPLVDPDKPIYGDEVRGLLLARRALDAATEADRGVIRESLAWADFHLGRLEDALAQAERLLDEVPGNRLKEFEGVMAKLEAAAQGWKGESAHADRRREREALLLEVTELDRVVSERRIWGFENPEDSWWQVQLSKLVMELDVLQDSKSGLMGDTLAVPFGWGVQKRYEFAKSIRERSIDGEEAKKRWADARAAIRASTKYGGLNLAPQLGLLPLGEDRSSHLWEFAHLQTGTAPDRSSDGKLILDEGTCLVFVLIPGGSFTMGAQSTDSSRPNYDSSAKSVESPAHSVTLRAYFLSKYEMTQGQWLRFAGRNPSTYQPSYNLAGHQHNLLHPVESVTWTECVAVMNGLGLSLPSEAQWENGCRGGTDTPWWSGQLRESLRGNVNIADRTAGAAGATWVEIKDWPDFDDGWVVHAAVGSFPANPFGLHEVHGNVWEWCADGFDNGFYARSPKLDPLASTVGATDRMLRGGGFISSASAVRSSERRSNTPEARNYYLGLRPALAITP